MLRAGASAAAPRSLVRDGGFEQSRPGSISPAWTAHGSGEVATDVKHGGRRSLRVESSSLIEQNVFALAPEGAQVSNLRHLASGWLRARVGLVGRGCLSPPSSVRRARAPAAPWLAFADFAQVKGTSEWTRYTHAFQVAAGATRVSLRAGIYNATGEAWDDDLTLVEGREPAEWTADMDVEQAVASRGERVAILRDDLSRAGAPSSPEHLAQLLSSAGIETAFVNAAELADPNVFNTANFDLVVLPYGPSFPLGACRVFEQFLAGGGDFVSMGGYAFDDLVARTPAGWVPQAELLAALQERLPIGGGFEGAPWETDTPGVCAIATGGAHSGERSLRVQVPAGAELLSGGCYHDVAVEPGQDYVLSGWIKASALAREADGFAFIAEYQYDQDAKLVAFRDIAHVTAAQEWQRYEWRFRIEARAAKLRIIAGLYNTSGTAWFDDVDLVRVPPVVAMNTRTGTPGDGLGVSALQIGVFDPSYPLERAAYARGTGEASVFADDLRIGGPLEGWAASGVVGWNQARWVSLINAYDRYGRLRGSAGALQRNYAGTYARSSWGFFGVTNQDLFAPGGEGMARGFVRLVRLMLSETYLNNLAADLASYHQGEPVNISVRASNFGRRAQQVRLRFEIRAENLEAASPAVSGYLQPTPGEVVTTIGPGETSLIEARWNPARFDHSFYRVTAVLAFGGRIADRMETGFCVSDEAAALRPFDRLRVALSNVEGRQAQDRPRGRVGRPERSRGSAASGPAVEFADNYVEAGAVRHFLLGTDTYGNMFGSAAQNPLTWARDLGMMRDHGITVYENLQVDPARFAAPYAPDQRFARQAEAMVQLAQQRRLIYVPGLLIGYNTAPGEDELRQQAGWCETFAGMFAQTPGIIYYTNGDLRLDLQDTPDMRRDFAAFLQARYATPEALQEAWRAEPTIASLDQVGLGPWVSRGWEDLRARDWLLFQWSLVGRWLAAMHDACKAGDPDRPTTVEFYNRPFGGVDLRATLGPVNIGNMGYFGLKGSDLQQFPSMLKFSDMRAYGQGLSIGEFGCKTHPAWAEDRTYHQTRTEQEQLDLYLAVPHYALGLGACKVHNWCWADAEENIFPWGLVHSNDRVPKRVLAAYRNTALLFKHFEPEYREPQVWVVVPTSHRSGSNGDQVYQAVLQCIVGLIEARVDFGVIDEERLVGRACLRPPADSAGAPAAAGMASPPYNGGLPAAARLLFWPLPYCPSDAAVAAIEGFVRAGGYAYISGDISFDPDRKRTRTDRLERLAGVRVGRACLRPPPDSAGARAAAGMGIPALQFGLAAPDGPAPEARVIEAPWFGLEAWQGWPAIEVEPGGGEVVARGPAGELRLVVNRIGAGAVIYTPDVLEALPDSAAAVRAVYRAVLGFAGLEGLRVEPDLPGLHAFSVPTRASGPSTLRPAQGRPEQRRGATSSGPPQGAGGPSRAESRGGEAYILFNAAPGGGRRVMLDTAKHKYELTLGLDSCGFILEDASGRTVAVESCGPVRRDGRVLVNTDARFMLAAEDGRDLPESRALLLMPLNAGRVGRVTITRAAYDADLSAQAGEVVGGRWTPFEDIGLTASPASIRLELDGDRAVSLIVIGAGRDVARLGQSVARILCEP